MFQKSRMARLITGFAVICSIIFIGEATLRVGCAQPPDQIHLYFFTNPGCAPCRQVEPEIESLKREGYPVTTIMLNDQPQMGVQFQVDRTPTVILVAGNRIRGRRAGLIKKPELKQWFASVGMPSGSATVATPARGAPVGPSGQRELERSSDSSSTAGLSSFSTPTMHQGTRQPANSAEQLALQATVRLKVEDAKGTSYATGTVIHSSEGECLVLTCGHVFREAQWTGIVSAEYGLGSGPVKTGSGKLVFFDSEARDIGLVVIQTEYRIEPVSIAMKNTPIGKGNDVFSLGCDRGALPTIRHSKIKNRAAYNGEVKYDIYGRPVDGRSGGGLFNSSGELIGVCNAAVVDVDEGIYTALDTVHWQIAQVNLGHLFARSPNTRIASIPPGAGPSNPALSGNVARQHREIGLPMTLVSNPARPINAGPRGGFTEIRSHPGPSPVLTQAIWRSGNGPAKNDQEVIIIVRSRSHPSRAETITISNPTPELLEYLQKTSASMSPSRQVNMARLRTSNRPAAK